MEQRENGERRKNDSKKGEGKRCLKKTPLQGHNGKRRICLVSSPYTTLLGPVHLCIKHHDACPSPAACFFPSSSVGASMCVTGQQDSFSISLSYYIHAAMLLHQSRQVEEEHLAPGAGGTEDLAPAWACFTVLELHRWVLLSASSIIHITRTTRPQVPTVPGATQIKSKHFHVNSSWEAWLR